MNITVSSKEINKVVSDALREKAQQEPKMDIEHRVWFGGKDYKLNFTRRYHRGHVSLCIPASCDAGDNCCHLRKINDIDLCYTGSDNYELLGDKSEGIIIDNINESAENKIFTAVNHILSLIYEQTQL